MTVLRISPTEILEKTLRLEFLSFLLRFNGATKLRTTATASKINIALFTTLNKLL